MSEFELMRIAEAIAWLAFVVAFVKHLWRTAR